MSWAHPFMWSAYSRKPAVLTAQQAIQVFITLWPDYARNEALRVPSSAITPNDRRFAHAAVMRVAYATKGWKIVTALWDSKSGAKDLAKTFSQEVVKVLFADKSAQALMKGEKAALALTAVAHSKRAAWQQRVMDGDDSSLFADGLS